jgi:hypothetical protein
MSSDKFPPEQSGADDVGNVRFDVMVANWVAVAFQRDFCKMSEAEKQGFRDQYAERYGRRMGRPALPA